MILCVLRSQILRRGRVLTPCTQKTLNGLDVHKQFLVRVTGLLHSNDDSIYEVVLGGSEFASRSGKRYPYETRIYFEVRVLFLFLLLVYILL